MMKRKVFLVLIVVFGIWTFPGTTPTAAAEPDITGLWYGSGVVFGVGSGTIRVSLVDSPDGLWAQTHIPAVGLFDQYLPAAIEETPDGTLVTFVAPGLLEMSGVLDGNFISGSLILFVYGTPYAGNWYIVKDTGEVRLPGEPPGPVCDDLSPLYCTGSAENCSELLPFLPEFGPGYLNYPLNGETWEDQYRSYATRDVMHLVKYAAGKVDCKAANWSYGNFAPLGLGDMSEADGSIPGTSIGNPGHPPGSHENGNDIDIAYYQLYAPDNVLRPVGVHCYGPFMDAFHLLGSPYALDVWRTALFIAYLSEHPRLRVIGVDGQIGAVLEDAFDALVELGWIDSDLRDSIPLIYEEVDTGMGWFYFHHHHMHVSMNPIYDLVSSSELKPDTLNTESQGQFVTAFIELYEGLDTTLINPETVALILDGHTILYAEPGHSEISDYNGNGVADLTVKFDRQAVLESIDNGMVEISIAGLMDVWFFQVSDTIRVIGQRPPNSNQEERSDRQHAPLVRPGPQGIQTHSGGF
jgi:hypothetical protein